MTPDADLFARSWAAAWTGLRAAGDGHALRDALLDAWALPARRYHTREHLAECLAGAEAFAALAERPAEVAMALWFHDAVYLPRAPDNEARSAEWAVRALGEASVDAQAVQRIAAHVMATRHDAVPEAGDAALVVDLDLAILAAEPARFDAYERQVRDEYRWVPGPLFRRKRREILQALLARPALYATPALHARYEAPARANLARSLAALR